MMNTIDKKTENERRFLSCDRFERVSKFNIVAIVKAKDVKSFATANCMADNNLKWKSMHAHHSCFVLVYHYNIGCQATNPQHSKVYSLFRSLSALPVSLCCFTHLLSFNRKHSRNIKMEMKRFKQ